MQGLAVTRSGLISDSIFSVGDLYPMITLNWHDGVHNWMTYATGDIPVGAYDPNRLANIGIGHGAIDAGAGYTYLNPVTGHEFSGVGGFTYNFKNQDTQYQNGIDFHFDWGASQFLSKRGFRGPRRLCVSAGYCGFRSTPDSGAVQVGVGPQVGLGDMKGCLNVKGYGEFDQANRPAGWNTWVTFAISQEPPASTVTPTRHMVTK